MEIHAIFFVNFSLELYEWIVRLPNSLGRCKLNQQFVRRLEAYEDKIVRAVDHWLDRIIRGFITEFTIDTTVRYR